MFESLTTVLSSDNVADRLLTIFQLITSARALSHERWAASELKTARVQAEQVTDASEKLLREQTFSVKIHKAIKDHDEAFLKDVLGKTGVLSKEVVDEVVGKLLEEVAPATDYKELPQVVGELLKEAIKD